MPFGIEDLRVFQAKVEKIWEKREIFFRFPGESWMGVFKKSINFID
jgi:hypothetical protein